jgi:hypothetical protein
MGLRSGFVLCDGCRLIWRADRVGFGVTPLHVPACAECRPELPADDAILRPFARARPYMVHARAS